MPTKVMVNNLDSDEYRNLITILPKVKSLGKILELDGENIVIEFNSTQELIDTVKFICQYDNPEFYVQD